MSEPITGREGALLRIEAITKTDRVNFYLQTLIAQAPERAHKAMGEAVNFLVAQSALHAPVRGSATARKRKAPQGRFARVGRGQLRQRINAGGTVRREGLTVQGGIVVDVPYAIWLFAGTRYIAGGRVMQWKPGDAPIADWPAKTERTAMGSAGRAGNPDALLPIIAPWFHEARDRFCELVQKGLF